MSVPAGKDVCTRVWLRQTCVACGAIYSQATDWRARAEMMGPGKWMGADNTLERIRTLHSGMAKSSSQLCPCPDCGWIQPLRLASDASMAVGFTLLVVFACGLILAVYGFGFLSPVLAVELIAGCIALAALFHAYRSLRRPGVRHLKDRSPSSRPAEGDSVVERPGGEFALPEHDRLFRRLARRAWVGLSVAVVTSLVPLAVPTAFWYAEATAVILFFWWGRDLYFMQWKVSEGYPKPEVSHAESQLVDAGASPGPWQGPNSR
jgi:hypothetical protein